MDHILSLLARLNIKARTVSVSHLQELEEDIRKPLVRGDISEGFYRERLSHYQFSLPSSVPEARTIIITAFPQPTLEVKFNLDGKQLPVKIPPTYLYYSDSLIQKFVETMLYPLGYQVTSSCLPLKLLGVRSGLGKYGRNNICYVPGMGSYHRLAAFFSDYPAEADSWGPARAMNSCRTCQLCLNACPSGAIHPDRFLLSAERCLTYLNEGESDFPPWLDPASHNALVGCLRCQEVCPANSRIKHSIIPGGEFSEEETRIIIESEKLDIHNMPLTLKEKLNNLDLLEYTYLPRNLRALLSIETD